METKKLEKPQYNVKTYNRVYNTLEDHPPVSIGNLRRLVASLDTGGTRGETLAVADWLTRYTGMRRKYLRALRRYRNEMPIEYL